MPHRVALRWCAELPEVATLLFTVPVRSQQSILELEEEAITNKLIKRLSMLKDEKQAIANEVRAELVLGVKVLGVF